MSLRITVGQSCLPLLSTLILLNVQITEADLGHTTKVVLEWGQLKTGHHDARGLAESLPDAAIGEYQVS